MESIVKPAMMPRRRKRKMLKRRERFIERRARGRR